MTRRALVLLFATQGILGCSSVDSQATSGSVAQPVVAGETSPDALGFSIDRFQRWAVLGQLAKSGSQQYQGCSGTLVGDRVVVSAAHCVVLNQAQWLNGATPQIVSADKLFYVVGDDVRAPTCLLAAQSVQIHPQAGTNSSNALIQHDVSVTILKDSVTATCPSVIPVQINRDALEQNLVGQMVLQGGFGALDESYDFSPVRYWSLLRISAITEDQVVVRNAQHGFPSFGDSGSGVLRRFPDGTLRNLGVCSQGSTERMGFMRLDPQGSFFDSVITPELLCGTITEKGVCRDGILVKCGTRGFTTKDCSAKGLQCTVGTDGSASCTIPADLASTSPDGGVAPDTGAVSSAQDGGGCTMAGLRSGASGMPSFALLAGLGLLLLAARRLQRAAQRDQLRRTVGVVTALAFAMLSAGCSNDGSSKQPTYDAAVSLDSTVTPPAHDLSIAPEPDLFSPPPPTGSCTSASALTDPDACGPGWSCDIADIECKLVGCRPVGTTPAFAVCSPHTQPCVAGTTCYGRDPANYKCLPFCTETYDARCLDQGICVRLSVTIAVCLAEGHCDVMTSKECTSSFAPACYFLDSSSGKTFCLPAGYVANGGTCRYDTDCKSGSGCQKNICARWCKVNEDCTGGATCQGIGDIPGHSDLGYCAKSE